VLTLMRLLFLWYDIIHAAVIDVLSFILGNEGR
jgi:hypothetical protein